MANDLIALMAHLSFENFSILAHDRGARVAHRLALDYKEKVEKMVLLDIAPTLWMYENTDMAFVSRDQDIERCILDEELSLKLRLRDIGTGSS